MVTSQSRHAAAMRSASAGPAAASPPYFSRCTASRATPSSAKGERSMSNPGGRPAQWRQSPGAASASQQREQRGPSARGRAARQRSHRNASPAVPQPAHTAGQASPMAAPPSVRSRSNVPMPRSIDAAFWRRYDHAAAILGSGGRAMARIKVLLFAMLADTAGVREAVLDIPEGLPVEALRERIVAALPVLGMIGPNVVFAVNAEYASADLPLHDGDEVALIPPVSGGAHV
ncbi:MAG: MoaD/ThiS family protein [Dehalococcoidia bacterium]|nr:MoaD/ThiS family protein [Dehalococcoidia bacterium]